VAVLIGRSSCAAGSVQPAFSLFLFAQRWPKAPSVIFAGAKAAASCAMIVTYRQRAHKQKAASQCGTALMMKKKMNAFEQGHSSARKLQHSALLYPAKDRQCAIHEVGHLQARPAPLESPNCVQMRQLSCVEQSLFSVVLSRAE
jgi:hypothetical protein